MKFLKRLFKKFEVRHRKKDKNFVTQETTYGDTESGIQILACDMMDYILYYTKHSNIILTYIIDIVSKDMIKDMHQTVSAMERNGIRVTMHMSDSQILYIISGSIMQFELLDMEYGLSYHLGYNKPLRLILNQLKLYKLIGNDAFKEAEINDDTSISNVFSATRPFFQPAPKLDDSIMESFDLKDNIFDKHRIVYLTDSSNTSFETITYHQLNVFLQGDRPYTHYLDEILDSCSHLITTELGILSEEGENFINNITIEALYDDIDEPID